MWRVRAVLRSVVRLGKVEAAVCLRGSLAEQVPHSPGSPGPPSVRMPWGGFDPLVFLQPPGVPS